MMLMTSALSRKGKPIMSLNNVIWVCIHNRPLRSFAYNHFMTLLLHCNTEREFRISSRIFPIAIAFNVVCLSFTC